MKRDELIAEMANLKIREPIEEQIRDHILQIVGNVESMCSIVLQDIIVSPSILGDINKHMRDEGKKLAKGNCFCYTMEAAEKLIRAYLGLPERDSTEPDTGYQPAPADNIIDLASFL